MEMEKQEVHTTEKNEKPSIFKVIWKPAEQFAKVRRKPVILVPMLILLAVYAIGTYMTASVVDYAKYFEEEKTDARQQSFGPAAGALLPSGL